MNAIRRVVRFLRLSAQHAERTVGLSGAQLFVLQQVRERPAASLAELAERTVTDPSSVSAVVQRLANAGLVRKTRARRDRRRATLTLTDRGRALVRRAPSAAQERLARALGTLPEADAAALERGLSALTKKMGLSQGLPPMFFEDRRS
jgi:DNA-binding MarR family transcriptional regulator